MPYRNQQHHDNLPENRIPSNIRVILLGGIRAIINNKGKTGETLRSNGFEYKEIQGGWILIYQNSYIAIPDSVIKELRHHPAIEALIKRPQFKTTLQGVMVYVYSINEPLSVLISKGMNDSVEDILNKE